MNIASIVGLASAIILILALMIGEISIVFPHVESLKITSIAATLIGLSLVVAASAIVLYESMIIHRQLETELLDLPELAHGIGEEAGVIGDEARSHD